MINKIEINQDNYEHIVFKTQSKFNNNKLLKEIVEQSDSFSDVCRKFNMSISSGNLKTLKKYINIFNISLEHFTYSKTALKTDYKSYYKSENIFVVNSPVSNSTIKKRILKENLITYKCKCGNNGKWQGEEITLQLEHKNGDNTDNRLENLEFLCPNCHAITKTWCGKNKKNIKSKDDNIFLIHKTKIYIMLNEDKKNLINNLLPYCNTFKDICSKYGFVENSINREKIRLFLYSVKDESNLILEFLEKANRKIIYPELNTLIDSVKEKGFVKVGKDLGCSDNAVRKYLIKQGIDLKSIK